MLRRRNSSSRASQLTQSFTREAERLKDSSDTAHATLVKLIDTLREASAGAQTLIGETAGLVEELRWLGALLGYARDDEVLAAHLTEALKSVPPELAIGPVSARIVGHYAPEGAAAHRALLDGLGSDRYLQLLDSLDQLLDTPPLTRAAAKRADKALPPLVWKAFLRVRDRMDQAQADGQAGPELNQALHAVGIQGSRWLGSPRDALPALMVVAIWRHVGYDMVIFLAGLQAVPRGSEGWCSTTTWPPGVSSDNSRSSQASCSSPRKPCTWPGTSESSVTTFSPPTRVL